VVTCLKCRSELPVSAKFCLECGESVAAGPRTETRFTSPESYTPKHLAEKILTSKSALEGERKQVTVLFADLKGSMELLADRDPEEARKLLDPVLEHMMEAVHRYEGTVNQVMGDGIMALFGAPLAHEDHAVRACYAALRMQESVQKYADGVRRSEGLSIHIRVGLNSGEVVVRAIDSDLHMDYTAVGQTTHLAARMEQMASPSTTLLTAETLRLAEGLVEAVPLGPMHVKGLAVPVAAYELMGAGRARSRIQVAVLRGLTRFVGRNVEVEQIQRAFDLAHDGRGQICAVVGEPGVGKSRLFYELVHSHRTRDWLVIESRSVPYGKTTSYLPVIDLLKNYFEIHDRDSRGEIRTKVTGKVLGLDRTLETVLPPLLALLDASLGDEAWTALHPAQRRQRTHDAIKRLVLREGRQRPVLLLVEDLHWIDSETQALLDGLIESIPASPLLMLVNYRPEYTHGWGGKTYYTQLRLDALSVETSGDLLDTLLGHDPTLRPLKVLLAGRTAGNPLFLEESVRSLVETRALTGAPGAYHLAQALDTLHVPPSVQAILATRIDRLAPDDKRLLQSASVIGRDVPFVLLSAIAEQEDSALRASLARLQSAEFLYETGMFPDLEYTFKHALTHETTYGGVLAERRRALHARLVEVIERVAADRGTEQIERLALHAFLGEVWGKAFEYLRGAGQRAATRSAFGDAALHFQNALVAGRHLSDAREQLEWTYEILLSRGEALFALSKFEESLASVREAEAIALRLADERRLGRIWNRQSMHHWIRSEAVPALALAERTRALPASADDLGLHGPARDMVGRCCFSLGEYRRAVAEFSENLRIVKGELERARFGSNLLLSVSSLYFLTWCHADLGEFSESDARAVEAVRIAEAAANPHSVVAAHAATGYSALVRGDVAHSVETLEKSMSLCLEFQINVWFPLIASFLGYAYALAGRLADAIALQERGLAEPGAEKGHRILRLGATYLMAGRSDQSRALAQQAFDESLHGAQRGQRAWALHLLGDIASAGDPLDTETAESRYGEALTLAGELSMRPLVAHCHLGLGKLYRRTGKREQAQEHLTTATTMYREMDMLFWLEQAEVAMREPG
jgi:predicted ATPase/class 3 adenylate cyclase